MNFKSVFKFDPSGAFRGGGMFGKMPAMGKTAKAKDEFTFAYQVALLAGGAVLTQVSAKVKVKEDGEDVLTPPVKQASSALPGELAKGK